jgi:fatty-acid desaturase
MVTGGLIDWLWSPEIGTPIMYVAFATWFVGWILHRVGTKNHDSDKGSG